jgi:hypothetical protein
MVSEGPSRELTLGAGVYNWRFVPVAGETFTDSGTGRCH